MPRYLYIFTYQTPEQQAAALGREFSDESCEALFIEAEAADKALEWGRQVSEKHVSRLFGSWDVSWAARHFAHWIESGFLFEEFIMREIGAGRLTLDAKGQGGKVLLHGHCHQKAPIGTAPTVAILKAADYEVS